MPQYVQLPNGQYFPMKEGENPYAAIVEAQKLYPSIFGIEEKKAPEGPPPESGFVPAFKASASSLKSGLAALAGRTGLMDAARAEQIAKEEEAYQQKTFKPTEKGWFEAPGTKFGELVGGSLPYMAAPAVAGLGALAIPEELAAAPVIAGGSALLDALGVGTVGQAAAGAGAGLTSATQFTGTNLARQMQEGKTLEQTNLGAAALAAIPQAAFDVFGLKMVPGVRNIFGEVGAKLTDAEAREIATQGLAKVVKDYALQTGKAMGAEGLTEAAQQVLERLQAGLSITDAQARQEYFDNFVGGAALAGALGPAGRYVERGAARSQAAQADRNDQLKAQQEQQLLAAQQKQQQEAFKQTPEYLTDLANRWTAFDTQYKDLLAKTKIKVPSGDLIAAANKKEAQNALKELMSDPNTQDLINEYRPYDAQIKAQQALAAQNQATAEQQAEYDKRMQQPGAQQELFGAVPLPPGQQQFDLFGNPIEQKEPEERVPDAATYVGAHLQIARELDQAKQQAALSENEDEVAKHAQNYATLKAKQEELEKLRPKVEAQHGALLPKIEDFDFEKADLDLKNERTKLQKAKDLGDMDGIIKSSAKIQELKNKASLFSDENRRGAHEAELANQIAQGAEEARNRFTRVVKPVDEEIAALKNMSADTPVANAIKQKKLDDARALRDLFNGETQDWQKLKADPSSIQYQQDRLDLQAQLKKEIKAHEKAGETEIAAAKQKSLDDLNHRIEIGQKYGNVSREAEPSNTQLIDKNVSDLLDRLLPGAIGEQGKQGTVVSPEKAIAARTERENKLKELRERQAELKAIIPKLHAEIAQGLQRPAYNDLVEEYKANAEHIDQLESFETKTARVAGERALPIQAAQEQLQRIKQNQEILAELNEQIQKAGRPTDPQKKEALKLLDQQRDYVRSEIKDATDKYNRLAEYEQKTGEKEAPAQQDLFGAFEEAKAEYNPIKKQLDAAYAQRDQIKADLNRRGQIASTPQMQALLDAYAKEPSGKLERISKEIERLEAEHERLTGKLSDRHSAFAIEREAEKQPTVRGPEQKQLPGFGLKQYTELKKPVPAEVMNEAKTKLVELQRQMEGLRKAAGNVPNPLMQEKLQNRIDKAKAKVEELERKQRMFEAQEDVIRGAFPGQREGEKLAAGAGYVSGKGNVRTSPTKKSSWGIKNVVRTKDEKPSALAEAAEKTKRAQTILDNATKEKELAEEQNRPAIADAKKRLTDLNLVVRSLAKQLEADHAITQDRNVAVLNEIYALQDFLRLYEPNAPLDNPDLIVERFERPIEPEEVNRLALQMQQNVSNADNMVLPLELQLETFKHAYNDLHKQGYSPDVLQGHIDDLMAAAEKVEKAHRAATIRYAMARRDWLAFQYASSKKLQATYAEAVKARDDEQTAQSSDPILKEAADKIGKANEIKEKAEQLLLEKINKQTEEERKIRADARLKQEALEKEVKEAKKTREGGLSPAQMARAREGAGLEGTRVETNTNTKLVDVARNNARKMLGMAQTQLQKAREEDNVDRVRQLEREVQRYEKALEQVQPLGERTKTPITEEKKETTEQKAEPGKRLIPRKEGPVVRTAARAPSTMLSGTKESREPIGKRNPPQQAGVIRLRASDMDHAAANAISLATLNKKIKATKDEATKATYQEAYDAATKGMTKAQINERIKEGERLLESGPTLAVIAATERFKVANEELKKAIRDLKDAEKSATKEFPNEAAIKLAEDAYEAAADKRDAAEAAMKRAVEKHEDSLKTTKASSTAVQKDTAAEKAEEMIDKDLGVTIAPKDFGEDLPGRIISGDLEFPNKREDLGTPLSNDALGNLLDGNIGKTLDHIIQDNLGFLSDRAKEIRGLVYNAKVKIVPEILHKGEKVPALYDPKTNTLFFTPAGFTNEDVVHEATHAATMRVLTMPEKDLKPHQLKARRELAAMLKKLQSDSKFEGQYGMENLKEFASEVFSNANLRELMDKKPWFSGNMFMRFIKAVLNFFSPKPLSEDMLTRAENLIRDTFMQSRVINNEEAAASGRSYNSALVGTDPGKWETFRGNFMGLGGRVQLVDKLAAADAAIVSAESADKLTSLEAFQAQYFMRMGDQVSSAAGQFILHGPMKVVSENTPYGKEYRYESQKGANLVDVSNHISDLANALKTSAEDAERMTTVLISGERANALQNGWSRLMSNDPAKVKAEYDADIRKINANPKAKSAYEAAKKAYKEYNDGQLDFAVDTGFLSKEEAERLKRTPYIPFYRIENGVVKLFTEREHAIVIGNIKDNPDLQRMVGDNKHILPILTSAVQNTFMLTRMSLSNKATLETANALQKAGFVSKMGTGMGPAYKDAVHYKLKGKNAFAVIDTDTFGIPAHLIVKGMEGIKTTIPAFVQMMGIPAQYVRKFVTRSPAYAVRQLIRDPINSFILSGTDGVPMVSALKQLAKMQTGSSTAESELMRGLAISSNVFSGDEKDMTKFLQDITTGRSGWQKWVGKLDRLALQADTATKATIYEDSLKKGLTKAQAQFRAFESQNLSRRGLSPSMQMLNTLIPFFNSQIQGLDVLYRSLTGKMPFAQEMDLRRKIVARSVMLMGVSLAYATMMQDDDDYRKTKPEERYGNFFIHIPFVKDALKIPIPYEIGLLFKALPEMIIDSMHKEMTPYEAIKGMAKLTFQNAVPNLIPAAVKPALEAAYGETLQGPIETDREKRMVASERYRPETTELARFIGGITGLAGISPIMLEHFVRGYTGSLGIAAMHMVDPLFASGAEGEKASTPASKMPFIGSMFQSSQGRYLIERAYERMDDVEKAQNTYKDMLKKGQRANAESFRQNYVNLVSAGSMAGAFRKNMGEMYAQERVIRANPRMTAEEKDAKLEALFERENAYARNFTERVDRRIHQ